MGHNFFFETITFLAISRDILRGPRLFWTLRMSLEMVKKVIVPQKKNYVVVLADLKTITYCYECRSKLKISFLLLLLKWFICVFFISSICGGWVQQQYSLVLWSCNMIGEGYTDPSYLGPLPLHHYPYKLLTHALAVRQLFLYGVIAIT